MEERRLNWKHIIITTVITGVVAIATGMSLFYFQRREPRLVYSVEDAFPFESPEKNYAIYHVKIENNGKKSVKEIICHVSYSPATIEQYRVKAEPSLDYKDSISESKNSYRVEFVDLHPNENVVISVLASCLDELPLHPVISLRGENIIGIERPKKDYFSQSGLFQFTPTLLGAYAGLFSLFLLMWFSKFRIFGSRHGDDQRKILSFLCGLHNLPREVERYLNMPSKTSYWAESDRMAMLAVKNLTGEDAEKRKKILKDLLDYAAISTSSRSIIHYNIARIDKAQGNNDESESHLKEAKKHISKLIETRLKLDPIFKKGND